MLPQMTGLMEFSLLSGGRRFVPKKVCSETVYFTATVAGKLISSIFKRFTCIWGYLRGTCFIFTTLCSYCYQRFSRKIVCSDIYLLVFKQMAKTSEEEDVYEIHVPNYYNILEIQFQGSTLPPWSGRFLCFKRNNNTIKPQSL